VVSQAKVAKLFTAIRAAAIFLLSYKKKRFLTLDEERETTTTATLKRLPLFSLVSFSQTSHFQFLLERIDAQRCCPAYKRNNNTRHQANNS
jgi:hypothetical protein